MHEKQNFTKLGDYTYPSIPTQRFIKLYFSRMRRLLNGESDTAYITSDQLQQTDQSVVDHFITPPSYAYLISDLNLTIGSWLNDQTTLTKYQLVVLPPGDADLMIDWADSNKLAILDAPARSELIAGSSDKQQQPETEIELPLAPVIVIPKLERWFLRHRNGLGMIRQLLKKIEDTDAKFVIGCNSWAWVFLKKAVGAENIFPEALTPQAYGQKRLTDWFTDMRECYKGEQVVFKSSKTGKKLLGDKSNEESNRKYFHELAAESLGIPWIAWALFRNSVRIKNELKESTVVAQEEAKPAKDSTLWIAALEEFILPQQQNEELLLILQALLLHSKLSKSELDLVLPISPSTNGFSALVKSGVVLRTDEGYACNPVAYPAVRKVLSSAGFPLDKL